MLEFVTKPDGNNYADCDGTYTLDESKGTMNGKPVYINDAKRRFLAAYERSGWCIASIDYLADVLGSQGNFGGYHMGGGKEPEEGEWDNYIVAPICKLDFVTKAACDNYANCDGTYTLDESKGTINKRPVYINKEKHRLLAAYVGSGWCIASIDYLDELLSSQGNFGGFHTGGGIEPEDDDWKNYTVTVHGKRRTLSPADSFACDAAAWCKYENTTVSFKAVSNSGVCRSESDFKKNRSRCVEEDCGGFAWRKPHFNQFGEEDDPPVCFFFRRTQTELRDAMQCTDLFDFYIAPEAFCPDCTFRPGRDPAPSCHVRWQTGNPVHAFACQVSVDEPSPCTFYMACGFHCGYCGIQQHNGDKQQVLFSLWDHPKAEGRVENRTTCEGMCAKPFGGEGKGMGAYSISGAKEAESYPLARWSAGETYTFVVRSFLAEGGSEYVCLLHKPETESGWIELARHFRPEPEAKQRGKLWGLHSFIEDFAGNSVRRSGVYAAWVQVEQQDEWQPVARVTGTTTAELDVPNKRVALSDVGGWPRIEMVSGGDVLEDFSVFEGEFDAPPVPAVLADLP